ncbi:MAG: metallophosphoesterase [Myxococcales bacterium]|nr:metallophosphoesterase [Myxococcales bacterium]
MGDIHGRFHRVREWIAALESARGRSASLVLAVGDVEAFLTADDHRRKAAKRAMPAEFADYVSGRCAFERPLHFIGGNNEDFEALHAIPDGGLVAPNLHFLGRVGAQSISGFDVAWLSGIYAPRYVDKPLLPPTTPDACRQAGYFRHDEVRALDGVASADIVLTHEWPRGLASRAPAASRGIHKDFRAFHTPWIGNQVSRSLVERMRPRWLFCGHSHVPFATVLRHADGTETRIACLDQASRADGAVFWTEWRDGRAVLAGWGTSGEACWREGQPWDERRTPHAGVASKTPQPHRAGTPSEPMSRPDVSQRTSSVQQRTRRDADTSGPHSTRRVPPITGTHSTAAAREAPRADEPAIAHELERKAAGGER